MANMEKVAEEEEAEYESDSEEAVLPLAMRRREASDDDDDEYGEADYRERTFRIDRRVGICSYGESDGLGGAPEYDDEEDEFEEEEEVEFEEVAEELQEFEEKGIEVVPVIQIKEEKKENEPFVIPTAGAFYMHDDRFRDNGRGGRHRWTHGGRKLWQSKDEWKWGHDKFGDLTLQETRNKEFNTFIEESRPSKGHFRGCSNNWHRDCGIVKGNQSRDRDNSNNQNHSLKVVRGRGPVKYKPLTMSNNVIPLAKNKQTGRSQEAKSNNISARVLLHTSNSNAFLQEKTVADSIGRNRLYMGVSICPVAGNHLTNLPLQSSVTLSTYMAECSRSRVQRRGLPISARLSNQSSPSSNKVDGVSSWTQHPVDRGSGSQASPKALSSNSFEPGQLKSLPRSSRSKPVLVGDSGGIAQGSRRGSLLYGGTHSDKNFPASPALLSVMQYGAQHHGGLGVPAVLPRYAAQSQLGFRNSEMRWVPVLAGTARALGAVHRSPYIAVDGGYNAHPSGETSSIGVSINETGTNRLYSSSTPPHRLELVNEEFRQQQIKPRRYSEMNFNK